MICLDLDHPDIEAFITWKAREEQKVAAMVAGSRLCAKHLNEILALCTSQKGKETSTRGQQRPGGAGKREIWRQFEDSTSFHARWAKPVFQHSIQEENLRDPQPRWFLGF